MLPHLILIENLENIHIWWGETQMLQPGDWLAGWDLVVQFEAQNCQEDFFWAGREGEWSHKLPANSLSIIVIITIVGIIKQSFKLHRIS